MNKVCFPFGKRIRIAFHRNEYWKPGFVLSIDFGKGAGYIGGRTLYLAFNSGSRRWARRNRGLPWYSPILQCSLTRNANRVPYAARY